MDIPKNNKIVILNPWDSKGVRIADSIGIYPTIVGCGSGGYQMGYLLDRRGNDIPKSDGESNGELACVELLRICL